MTGRKIKEKYEGSTKRKDMRKGNQKKMGEKKIGMKEKNRYQLFIRVIKLKRQETDLLFLL